MTQQQIDHSYHRSRVDTHIQGAILFTATMAVMALLVGGKFQPFQPGSSVFEPVQLIWAESDQSWVAEKILVIAQNFPPTRNKGPLLRREIYPTSISVLLLVGTAAVAFFLYTCARRQTALMNAVYEHDPDDVYRRPWAEIRRTFWALYVSLAFVLLFFFS